MAEETLVKSTFKQRRYAKRYELKAEPRFGIDKKYYYSGYYMGRNIDNYFIDEVEIWTCEVAMPMLCVGELFYIEELKMSVTVLERVRSSSGGVVYYINSEYIEDEETQKTYQRVQDEIKRCCDATDYLDDFKKKADVYQSCLFKIPRWIRKIYKAV